MRKVTPMLIVLAACGLCGCSAVRSTSPPEAAAEQLLLSTAADRAAAALARQIPPNLKLYVDPANFSGDTGQYAIAAIEDRLLRRGDRLTTDRTTADAVVLVRAGALSTDERSTTLGLQQFSLPFFPLGNFLTVPEFDLYKRATATGVAKFAATVYDPKSGKLIVSTNPEIGESKQSTWVVLLLFSWTKEDFTPPMGKHLFYPLR